MSDVSRRATDLTHRVLRRGHRTWQQVQQRLRRTRSTVDGTPAAAVTTQLAELTGAGRHAEAVALAERHLTGLPTDVPFLDQVRASASKAGALTLQRRATELRLAATSAADILGRERVTAAARQLEGRWLETEPGWSPTIAPEVLAGLSPVTDPVPGRVLHVLKISMPQRQSGYTMRTMYTLVAEHASDLEPIAVTALDYPVSVGVSDAPEREEVRGIPHLRLTRGTPPAKEPFDTYLDAWATALAPVVAQQRPEVIHVHSGARGYESALVALAVGRALNVPVVYEVRGFFESLWTKDVAWSEQSEVYRRRRDTETRCMQAVDAVVTLSESMRQDILDRGVAPEKVFVVPNGVDTTAFVPRERNADLVEQTGLDGKFVFGYVSNLDHYREGQELLIDAAVALRARGIPAVALIVGDGQRRGFLERHAAQAGAGDAVVMTGKVPHDQVLDYYALLDVFVIPRIDERAARLVTPLKPFEAMAAGLPLLVSDLPALTEITGGGTRGVSFRAGDADALVDALADLYAHPEKRAALAAAGREWVDRERQWSANGPRYRAIYDRVTTARRA